MFCSMCNSVAVRDTHKCAVCGEICCRHIGKSCPKCRPEPAMEYDTNLRAWVPVDTQSQLDIEAEANANRQN